MIDIGRWMEKNLLFFGGSDGGGSSTTTNTMMPWAQYVPPEAYAAYKKLLPDLQAKQDMGLTPDEKAYYTGQGLTNLNASYTGASKDLSDNLARSGIGGGARAEAFSNLGRSRVIGGATMGSDLIGKDIAQKGVNTANVMKAVGIPGQPAVTGSTTTGKSGGGGS